MQRDDLKWHISPRPSDIAKIPKSPAKARLHKREAHKAWIREEAEHPFRVIKPQFDLVKVRLRGLHKYTAQLLTLFALSNLWMARSQLITMCETVRLETA